MSAGSERLAAKASALLERGAIPALGMVLLLTVLAGLYLPGALAFNANTRDLFRDDLDFRQNREALRAAFPQLDHQIIAVVDADVPEVAMAVADDLAGRFAASPELDAVHRPGAGEYFARQGLLFQSEEQLRVTVDRLAAAQPLLAALVRDSSPHGLFARLAAIVEGGDPALKHDLQPFLEELDETIAMALAGSPARLSWQRALAANADSGPPRQLVFARAKPDYQRLLRGATSIERARALAAETVAAMDFPVQIRFTGEEVLGYEELKAAMDGTATAGLLALVLVGVTLVVCLRSATLIFATLLSLVSGLVTTAALAMMLLEAFNMISIAFAVLFVGLGVDYAIHLCLRFREARHSCLTTAEALRTSLADLAPALALCALSTAAGFLSFALTDFKGVADLGIIASVGMVVSLGCTLTVVPGVAKLLRLKAVSGSPGGGIDSPVVFENTLAFGKRRRRSVRLVTLILAPVAVGALAWVDFDADPLKLRDPDSESVSTLRDLMADNALSPNDIEILADSPAAARVMAKRLQDVEGAGRVLSAFSFVPENQDTKLAQLDELNLLLLGTFFASSEPGNTGLKATREAANALRSALQADLNTATAERLVQTLGRLDERLKKPAGEGAQALLQRLDTALLGTFSQAIERLQLALEASPVTVDHLPAPLRSRWISPEGAYRIQVYPSETIETSEAKEALVAAVMRVAPTATGSLPTVLRAETVVASAFVQAFCSALVTIGVLLAVALRSLRDTLLVLLPLLLSAALTGAGCVLLGIDFNFANVIALPLLLGLGVDHGVHILHRLSGQDEGSAGVTARAVFFASLTTIFSFGNLAFSPHPGTASMGMVLTMGVLALLLTSLLVLPAFVPNRDPRREP